MIELVMRLKLPCMFLTAVSIDKGIFNDLISKELCHTIHFCDLFGHHSS